MFSYFNFSIFDNIPYRRIKKSVFKLGGLRTKYIRFYSVLPNMSKDEFDSHISRVRKLAQSVISIWLKLHENDKQLMFSATSLGILLGMEENNNQGDNW